MNIKRIILVTKFKESSERALKRALGLAKEHSAHLDILNVIDMPDEMQGSVDEKVEALDHSLMELIDHEKTMRQIIEKSGKHKWTPEAHITMENPNQTKDRMLTMSDKDIIVIGFGDWSNQLDLTTYIAPDASVAPPACPIWMVPPKSRRNLRKQLVFVADGDPEKSQMHNFQRLCEVALKKEMSLDILLLNSKKEAFWDKSLSQMGIQGYSIKLCSSMEEVKDEIEKRKPGLLGIMIQSILTAEALEKMDSFSRADLMVI